MENNKQMNKTIRLKKLEKTYGNGSIRSSKKSNEKNYLKQTTSSSNKITQRFENNNNGHSQKIPLNMSKTAPTPIIRSKSKEYLARTFSFSKTQSYNDALNHFTDEGYFGYDPYGHFS